MIYLHVKLHFNSLVILAVRDGSIKKYKWMRLRDSSGLEGSLWNFYSSFWGTLQVLLTLSSTMHVFLLRLPSFLPLLLPFKITFISLEDFGKSGGGIWFLKITKSCYRQLFNNKYYLLSEKKSLLVHWKLLSEKVNIKCSVSKMRKCGIS